MRVFVTGTGRCGSVTFAKACSHITNYTSGHETHTNKRDADGRLAGDVLNLDYPDDHIEVSPQLAIQIPLLAERYYPDVFFVHLYRSDRDACARSLAQRSRMDCFATYHFLATTREADDLEVGYAVYDTMRSVARELVTGYGGIQFHLEDAKTQWRYFWEWLRAEGDYEAALAEWDHRYNQGHYDDG